MVTPEFALTAKEAISRDILDCSERTLYTLKKEGKMIKDIHYKLIEGIHYVKHYGKGHRYSKDALLKFRRDTEKR